MFGVNGSPSCTDLDRHPARRRLHRHPPQERAKRNVPRLERGLTDGGGTRLRAGWGVRDTLPLEVAEAPLQPVRVCLPLKLGLQHTEVGRISARQRDEDRRQRRGEDVVLEIDELGCEWNGVSADHRPEPQRLRRRRVDGWGRGREDLDRLERPGDRRAVVVVLERLANEDELPLPQIRRARSPAAVRVRQELPLRDRHEGGRMPHGKRIPMSSTRT